MTEQQFPIIKFSHEEMSVLMWVLNVRSMMGMGQTPFEGMSNEQAVLLMSAGERSLVARELIQVKGERSVELSPLVLGLVGPCVFPEASVLVSATEPGRGTLPFGLHMARGLFVEHSLPQARLHRFEALPDWAAMGSRAHSLMGLMDQDLQVEVSLEVTRKGYVEAGRVAFSQGAEEGGKLLVEAGVPAEAAALLAADLASPILTTAILVVLSSKDQQTRLAGFSLLHGKKHLWIVVNSRSEDEESNLLIQTVSAQQASDRLTELLRQASNAATAMNK